MFVGLLAIAVFVLAVVWFVVTYNGLVVAERRVASAWMSIDALLQQRHAELQQLIAICEQHMKHEREPLERARAARAAVLGARRSGDAAALARAEADLRGRLGKLFVLARQYPDLRTNEPFLELKARLGGIEASICEQRRSYNEAVTKNNGAIAQFPGSIVACVAGFKPFGLLEADADTNVDADLDAVLDA
jgi:LemA protein